MTGIDSEGDYCGRNGTRDLTHLPYLFYFDFLEPSSGLHPQHISLCFFSTPLSFFETTSTSLPTGYSRCVAQCPNSTLDFTANTTGLLSQVICKYDTPAPTSLSELYNDVSNGSCTALLYPGIVVIGRCFPDFNTLNLTAIADALGTSVGSSSIATKFSATLSADGFSFDIQRDLYAAWPVMLMLVPVLSSFFLLADVSACSI